METSSNIIFLILLTITSLAIGAIWALWLLKQRAEIAREQGRGEGRGELATLQERTRNFENEVGHLQKKLEEITAQKETLNEEKTQLSNSKTELKTILEKERSQTEEKLVLLDTAKETLTNQFKILAAEILDEKTKKFTEKNAENLSAILNPLTEKLSEFKIKVEETYDKESKLRFSLQEEIKKLVTTTTQIGTDATNLTQALKGESKTQGIWGEMILERVLERSGLPRLLSLSCSFRLSYL